MADHEHLGLVGLVDKISQANKNCSILNNLTNNNCESNMFCCQTSIVISKCWSLLIFRLTVMARNGYNKISPSEDKESVSFVSLLFFQWMNSIFKTGSERPLDENDFLPLSKENCSSFLTDQLQANWNKEKAKCDRNQKRPKLWKSVIKLISVKDVMFIVFTNVLYAMFRFL